MKLQLMPAGDRRCLLYSASMVFDRPIADIVKSVGHSGLEHIWPMYPFERSHHLQEIIMAGLGFGYACVYFEREPVLVHARSGASISLKNAPVCVRVLTYTPAILLTDTHAVAWDTRDVYDPARGVCGLDTISYDSGLLVLPTNSQD